MSSFGEKVGEGSVRLARLCWNQPWMVLALVLTLSAGALYGAKTLKLEADLSVLLPEHFESVKGLAELEERFGGVGYVVVVGEGEDPETLKRFADDLAPQLEALENIRYVDYQRPIDFFAERAFYFMELEDLELIRDQVKARIKWEKKKRNPMYIDLEESDPPSLDFTELEEKYQQSEQGEWLGRQSTKYYLDREAQMIVLMAKPTAMASDLSYGKKLLGEVSDLIASIDLSQYGALEVNLTGRYQKNIEQQARIGADLGVASILALLLLLGYLTFHLRSIVGTFLVIGPLLIGLLWMLGLTGFIFEHLNILTGFLGAILMGLGIDHGIHLMSRFQSERARQGSGVKALETTYRHTARAVLVAALTTASAFVALAFSDFRAFREFGIVAAMGLLAILSAYATLFPALLSLTARLGWTPPTLDEERTWTARVVRLILRGAAPVLAVIVVVVTFLMPRAGDARFNYDFAALEGNQSPAFILDQKVNQILGYSQTPVAILTEDASDEALVALALRDAIAKKGDSTIDFVATVADLVPEGQAEKRVVMDQISKSLKRVKKSQLDEDTQSAFADIKIMLKAEPFDRDTLPVELKRQFMGNAQEGGFVLIFPGISLADGELVSRFADEIRSVEAPGAGGVSASGEAMILADILAMVKAEGPPILLITLGLIALIIWSLMGSLKRALRVLTPIVALPLAILGFLFYSGIELNYMNIIVIPILLGVGVDGTVHLSSRGEEDGDWEEGIAETNRAILGGLITTGIGFSALLVAQHPGLNSIGVISLVGTSFNLLLVMGGFVAFLSLMRRFSQEAQGHSLVDKASAMIATTFMVGSAPIGPGTFGALVALPLAWWLGTLSLPIAVGVVALITLVGTLATSRYIKAYGRQEDPQEVVIDEVAGLLITALFIPHQWPWLIAAFVAFRAFDILKPWPVRWADQKIKGGLGVMLDDVLAGLMAGGLLLVAQLLL